MTLVRYTDTGFMKGKVNDIPFRVELRPRSGGFNVVGIPGADVHFYDARSVDGLKTVGIIWQRFLTNHPRSETELT